MRGIHVLCCSLDVRRAIRPSRRMRWAGNMARVKEGGAYGVLVRKPEGKTSLGRPRGRWEVNMKVDLRE